jgi:phosphonate transport system permease protein
MTSRVEILRRERPRSVLVQGTLFVLAALVVWSWTSGDIDVSDLLDARRLENLKSFLRDDVQPFALRGHPFTFSGLASWAGGLLASRGLTGSIQTLAISVLAISLAALGALCLAPFAARNLASGRPFSFLAGSFVPGPRRDRVRRIREGAWRASTLLARAFLVFLRAIPEYIWAFLLLAMLGPSAWPAVLALAVHNAGILGKLGAETIENLDAAPLRSLWWLGVRRRQITVFAVAPLALTRFLLYFFYRFETCVREATVLGLLGVVSLGYWIQDARARHFYDEMLFFVVLGAGIVLVGDVLSILARSFLRRAT